MSTQPGRPPVDPALMRVLRGAVPLDPRPATPPPALADTAPAPAPTADGADPGAVTVIDVTEATFQRDVIERSSQVPVVIDFWAEWCGPCKQLSPILEKLAAEGGGSWVLAKIDIDANQRIAQAAGVQGIPNVKVVIAGQVVGEFSGAVPEAQARQFVESVLDAGQQAGLTGPVAEGEQPAAPPVDPALEAADAALQSGDLPAARVALQGLLDREPANPVAKAGLAEVSLMERLQTLDPDAALAAAAAAPDDVPAQLAAADAEIGNGDVGAGLTRLVGVVARTRGEDRDPVRARLLELFDLLDPADPVVQKARRDLSNALF